MLRAGTPEPASARWRQVSTNGDFGSSLPRLVEVDARIPGATTFLLFFSLTTKEERNMSGRLDANDLTTRAALFLLALSTEVGNGRRPITIVIGDHEYGLNNLGQLMSRCIDRTTENPLDGWSVYIERDFQAMRRLFGRAPDDELKLALTAAGLGGLEVKT